MKFGRSKSAQQAETVEDDEVELLDDQELDVSDDSEQVDWRADGPFDSEEVDLDGDVPRIDLETLILTPWDGLNLQLQVDEQTRRVLAVTGVWGQSGLEVAVYAAPTRGSLAEELLAAAIAEATELGGTTETVTGAFGPELHRVLPQSGPKGEQLYHVSRVWYAEGPKWLLQATLLGEAALPGAEPSAAAPFVEFFRNLVVRRGNQPMVPGDRITMKLPEGAD